MNTNELVINKLAQILSYLRAGAKSKKARRKELKNLAEKQAMFASSSKTTSDIFEGVGSNYEVSSGKDKHRWAPVSS